MTLIFSPFEHLHNENIKLEIPFHSFILSSHTLRFLSRFEQGKYETISQTLFLFTLFLSTAAKFEPNFTVHLITSFPIA